MSTITREEIQALQNMANHACPGAVVYQKQETDKRKKIPLFFASIGKETTPCFRYAQLNCYLMGYAKGKAVSA
jgi:hypothetical protein